MRGVYKISCLLEIKYLKAKKIPSRDLNRQILLCWQKLIELDYLFLAKESSQHKFQIPPKISSAQMSVMKLERMREKSKLCNQRKQGSISG